MAPRASHPFRSPLARLRSTTERVTERVTTIEREMEFRALVASNTRNYDAMTKAGKFYDPLQTPPQWLPARFSDRQFALVGGSSLGVGLAGVFTTLLAVGMQALTLAGVAAIVAFLAIAVNIVTARFEEAERQRRAPEPRRILLLPKAVGRAYDDYVATVARLRAVDASEAVVAGIEAQIGFAGELVHEAARFHAAGASASPEAQEVRDTMVDMAAHAVALAATAEEHHRAREAAAVADPLLLSRAPDRDDFLALSHHITDETAAARQALNAATRTL